MRDELFIVIGSNSVDAGILMARYTNLFTTSNPGPKLRQTLTETLKSCDLNLVYETSDYLRAQEKPGRVTYLQLATVEVLITPPRLGKGRAKVNLIVKNEELPLKKNNHCQRVFELVNRAIQTLIAGNALRDGFPHNYTDRPKRPQPCH